MNKIICFLLVVACGWACQNQPADPSAPAVPTPPDELYEQMEKGEKKVDFHGMFTEPFRDVYLLGNELLLVDFEERFSYPLEKAFAPNETEQSFSFGDGQVVTIFQEPGSDGMSDRTYPYSIRWEDPDHPHLGGGDTLRMEDWSKYEQDMPAYYICYEGGGEQKLALSIAFSEDGTAIELQYRGQSEAIELREIDEKMSTEGAYPVIETTYQEMVKGQVNGIYVLTHAGNWDYAQYTRGRDGKEFSFTIDHEQSIQNDTYRTTPCYD